MSDYETISKALIEASRDLHEHDKEYHHHTRPETYDLITQALVALNDVRAEETWTDEDGTVWTQPTAWAYAKACKALEETKKKVDGQPDRWEIGFRNIVTAIKGSRLDFEIPEIMEIVQNLQNQLSGLKISSQLEKEERTAELLNLKNLYAASEALRMDMNKSQVQTNIRFNQLRERCEALEKEREEWMVKARAVTADLLGGPPADAEEEKLQKEAMATTNPIKAMDALTLLIASLKNKLLNSANFHQIGFD